MAQYVDVKGHGLVEFPDDIRRSVMLDALRSKFSKLNQGETVSSGIAAPYSPTLAERAAGAISSGLQKTGLISDNYRANRIGENITMGLEALPVIGDAIGGDELGRAIREGDVIGGGFAALGAIPIAGDAAKAFKNMSFKERASLARDKLTNEKLSELISQAENDGFNEFGIRVVSKNPVSGKQDSFEVGDILPSSFDWVDGGATDEQLGGTSTVGIDWDGWDIIDLDKKIKIIEQYLPMGDEIVIVGGKTGASFEGNDIGERVIPNAEVLGVIR